VETLKTTRGLLVIFSVPTRENNVFLLSFHRTVINTTQLFYFSYWFTPRYAPPALGGVSLGIAPSFPPPQKPSPGLSLPPCAEGVLTSTFFQTTAHSGSECLHTKKNTVKLSIWPFICIYVLWVLANKQIIIRFIKKIKKSNSIINSLRAFASRNCIEKMLREIALSTRFLKSHQ
jgi:hypothetical protein